MFDFHRIVATTLLAAITGMSLLLIGIIGAVAIALATGQLSTAAEIGVAIAVEVVAVLLLAGLAGTRRHVRAKAPSAGAQR